MLWPPFLFAGEGVGELEDAPEGEGVCEGVVLGGVIEDDPGVSWVFTEACGEAFEGGGFVCGPVFAR